MLSPEDEPKPSWSRVGVGGTQKNFSSGAISVTGRATDVAIEGDGFFIVDLAGERLYSRSGASN